MFVWTYLSSGLSQRKEGSFVGRPFDFILDLTPPLARDMKWPTESGLDILIRDIVWGAKSVLIYGILVSDVPCMHTWNKDGSCNNGKSEWRLLFPEEIAKKKKK